MPGHLLPFLLVLWIQLHSKHTQSSQIRMTGLFKRIHALYFSIGMTSERCHGKFLIKLPFSTSTMLNTSCCRMKSQCYLCTWYSLLHCSLRSWGPLCDIQFRYTHQEGANLSGITSWKSYSSLRIRYFAEQIPSISPLKGITTKCVRQT